MTRCRVHFRWNSPSAVREFHTGVSLHSHTMHSRESMSFLPRYTYGVPVLGGLVRQQERRYQQRWGKPMDYSLAWWTPPLGPKECLELERQQIRSLGLEPLVSLSDHDDIEANQRLRLLSEEVPISIEWTVPNAPSFFHLGVHNLPGANAAAITAELNAFTAGPDEARLAELLEMLDGMKDVLIIFNHPLWDEGRVGAETHAGLARAFLARYGQWIHALELNGLRSWEENRRVIDLARSFDKPVISGGDRHGCEPNANVNLTSAITFEEFAGEVREDGHSAVLFLEQYKEPLRLRFIETMWDALRDYPEHPGREKWGDRVFYLALDGSVKALSTKWEGEGPAFVNHFLAVIKLFRHRRVRLALKAALAEQEPAL